MIRTPRIAVLPPELANQIAAGEVVERPASVVKELVENAVDAGARRIDVEIDRGGLGLVRVTDDGCGMTEEEAQLALLRHATSKLGRLEDLFALSSMGFRGEALPSIAAVSRFQLTTRTAESDHAVRLFVEGGVAGPPRPASGQVGTQVEVRDLLYNVPARLKFMKGEATEGAHVSEALLRLGLAFPEVHLRLRSGSRLVLDLPPHAGRPERAQAALRGRRKAEGPLHLARGEEVGVAVEALLGAPDEAAATPRNFYLFVNRRFVRDRSLLHAVVMGYGEQLPKGRYPLCVLHLQIPPAEVDVNVHPQKLEVRFRRAQEVYDAVRHVVGRTALRAPWILPERVLRYGLPLREGAAAGEARARYGAAPAPIGPAGDGDDGEEAPGRVFAAGAAAPPPVLSDPPPGARSGRGLLDEDRARLQQALRLRAEAAPGSAGAGGAAGPSGAGGIDEPRRRFFSAMTYLGQYGRTYLLCEHERELVLIDQHAAHERLAFERLRAAQAQRGPLRSQRLLLPIQLELDPQRAALLAEEGDMLSGLGFEVMPLGGRSFALQAAPDMALFGRGARTYQDPERLLAKVLDDLVEHGRSDTVAARLERVLATLACHSVVRAGDLLDEARARALLDSMDEVEFYPHCPHGRPVLVRLQRSEIERRFGRA